MTEHEQGTMKQRYVETFEALARDGEAALPLLRELYHEQVQFEDPIQSVVGIEPFIDANRRLVRRAKSISLNIGTVAVQDGHLFAVWTMSFEPRMGPVMAFEGASHATFRDGRIAYQRDYWDLLSSAAGAVPGISMVYRRLVGLIA
jgi:ketosteroid isomerase-like protein